MSLTVSSADCTHATNFMLWHRLPSELKLKVITFVMPKIELHYDDTTSSGQVWDMKMLNDHHIVAWLESRCVNKEFNTLIVEVWKHNATACIEFDREMLAPPGIISNVWLDEYKERLMVSIPTNKFTQLRRLELCMTYGVHENFNERTRGLLCHCNRYHASSYCRLYSDSLDTASVVPSPLPIYRSVEEAHRGIKAKIMEEVGLRGADAEGLLEDITIHNKNYYNWKRLISPAAHAIPSAFDYIVESLMRVTISFERDPKGFDALDSAFNVGWDGKTSISFEKLPRTDKSEPLNKFLAIVEEITSRNFRLALNPNPSLGDPILNKIDALEEEDIWQIDCEQLEHMGLVQRMRMVLMHFETYWNPKWGDRAVLILEDRQMKDAVARAFGRELYG
ncbi:hypothetical protein K431DRAFT_298553 [Polychaeton citri CBS 116435]|uniref:Uncharacterized protein n=1 Tax=Polychaeton citri CBS 116435 TaxID=1314669 RepID=A0A9P4Q144_9PEZI|nr:hypothetical protein K431DRAFT_298553 [Polychaeton citri CBS 116435]